MLPWAFLGTGALAIGFTVVNLLRYRALQRRGVVTRGTIVDSVEDSDGVASIVVVFEDRAGRPHQLTSRGGMTGWGRKLGRPVTVAYDPARPERGRIGEDVRLQTWIGIVLAMVFAGCGVAALLK